jgi:hypothetical protein
MARTFKQRGNVSMLTLVRESGLCEVPMRPDVAELEEALVASETVDDWLEYSESRRVDWGWCVEQNNDAFVVGRLAEDGSVEILGTFIEKSRAVAHFLTQELTWLTQFAKRSATP